MSIEILKTEFTKMNDSYKRLDFAVINTNGLYHVLDTLRYERAFFLRQADIDLFKKAMGGNLGEFASLSSPKSIVLGRYSWPSNKWTEGRLLCGQFIKEVKDVNELYKLTDKAISKDIKPSLRWRVDVEVRGDLPDIFDLLLKERAMPCGEKDSHILEQAFYAASQSNITVTLTNFCATNVGWRI